MLCPLPSTIFSRLHFPDNSARMPIALSSLPDNAQALRRHPLRTSLGGALTSPLALASPPAPASLPLPQLAHTSVEQNHINDTMKSHPRIFMA